ncbi:cardiotrophin-like cytokine factor 1 [Xiphophorus hellerii]|uniref:cardiotrophin-like cytokine factor 1 n=1 Tax=Xiphophorus hellerii TaxID=8084 RepID=UPI0013B37865|nr:cardiotrophin-like cytokine factor 1 [Xiphophorus hellerii]
MAAAVATAVDPSHNLASERSSIESTYELTKYLEYQLKEIKDVYLTYLGPPFNEKDFSPPRPNSTALTLPSAATRLELWHGLENQARLAQNQRAYSILLAAVRELARSTLCPSLKTSLLHFCTGLDGLLGSISALMNSLRLLVPPSSCSWRAAVPAEGHWEQPACSAHEPEPVPIQRWVKNRVQSAWQPEKKSDKDGQREGRRRPDG